jgi:hypothetical protein
MVPEGEAVPDGHYVSLVFKVIVSEHLKNLDLNLALLVEFLLVLQDFEGDLLFARGSMVHAADDYAESPSAKLLHYFVAVVELVSLLNAKVVAVLRVEAVVEISI